MIPFWSLVLALAWVIMTGVITVPNLLIGYVLAAVVLLFLHRRPGNGPVLRLWRIISLAVFFVWELIVANVKVAYEVVTPRYRMRPAVVGIPLDATSDAEITLLANLISLTPGTLSLDVSQDRRTLYVHGMYVGDREAFVRSIKNGFERRVLEVMR